MTWILIAALAICVSGSSSMELSITARTQAADEKTVWPVVAPRPIHTPLPKYPKNLAKSGVTGNVLVWITVDEKGRPCEVSIKTSSGNDVLDQAALEGVRKWKFKAATKDGKPVKVQIDAQVNFAQ